MAEPLVIPDYLNLMDQQDENALSSIRGLTDEQIWRRPAPKEWSIGEIMEHNRMLFASTLPYLNFAWKYLRWYGERRRDKPYRTTVEDAYHSGKFPMWVGFLWTPKHNAAKPMPFTELEAKLHGTHEKARAFYQDKDEALLGNIFLFDPLFGFLNMILALRLGLYHDQLHYDDVIAQSLELQHGE